MSTGGDDLEPGIQTHDEGTQAEPLKSVSMVLGNVRSDLGPLPQQSVFRRFRNRACLNHRRIHHVGRPLFRQFLRRQILPDATEPGVTKLIDP